MRVMIQSHFVRKFPSSVIGFHKEIKGNRMLGIRLPKYGKVCITLMWYLKDITRNFSHSLFADMQCFVHFLQESANNILVDGQNLHFLTYTVNVVVFAEEGNFAKMLARPFTWGSFDDGSRSFFLNKIMWVFFFSRRGNFCDESNIGKRENYPSRKCPTCTVVQIVHATQ